MRVFTSLAKARLRLLPATPASLLARVAFCIGAALWFTAQAAEWAPLAQDGVHDPKSPGAKILQQPGAALSKLTPDVAGNQVRWVQALAKKEIQPREKLFPQTEVRKLDQDILLNLKGGMPIVRFPHSLHTEWLDCSNCHSGIFAAQTGGTKISMFKILQGEQCGVCHGAVAFPLTECLRCHSVPRPGSTVPMMPDGVDTLKHQIQSGKQAP